MDSVTIYVYSFSLIFVWSSNYSAYHPLSIMHFSIISLPLRPAVTLTLELCYSLFIRWSAPEWSSPPLPFLPFSIFPFSSRFYLVRLAAPCHFLPCIPQNVASNRHTLIYSLLMAEFYENIIIIFSSLHISIAVHEYEIFSPFLCNIFFHVFVMSLEKSCFQIIRGYSFLNNVIGYLCTGFRYATERKYVYWFDFQNIIGWKMTLVVRQG